MAYLKFQERLFKAVQLAHQADLIRMSAGNLSCRIREDRVAITPSGIPYREMGPKDISIVDFEGKLVEGPRPSSETPMHTAIYRNISRAESVCHTHSINAMVFAHLQEDVPLVNIELMVCGAPIPVAPWAAPGTDRAGEVTVKLFGSNPDLWVVLLRQHGLVALGSSPVRAYEYAYNAEIGLKTYFKSRLLGNPPPFTDSQIQEIRDVYRF